MLNYLRLILLLHIDIIKIHKKEKEVILKMNGDNT